MISNNYGIIFRLPIILFMTLLSSQVLKHQSFKLSLSGLENKVYNSKLKDSQIQIQLRHLYSKHLLCMTTSNLIKLMLPTLPLSLNSQINLNKLQLLISIYIQLTWVSLLPMLFKSILKSISLRIPHQKWFSTLKDSPKLLVQLINNYKYWLTV